MVMPSHPETVVDFVRWRAADQAGRGAFTFLVNGETEGAQLTYAETDRQARVFAALLQNYARPGERACLIFPQSLDFIIAFLGCLYAGVVAVPTYLPSLGKASGTSTTFTAIAKDARPVLVLTTSRLWPKMSSLFANVPELENVRWLTTDDATHASAADWREPRLSSDDIAFFQYTSGSTSFPKGVVVTHGNLLSNLRAICGATDNSEDSAGVTWLPMFHDMGLIACVLQPIYAGFHTYVMSPAAFLQSPFRWLNAITRFRLRTSCGPNFAYDLCVAKITAEQRERLDLSSWKLAACGAEPVHARTIEKFTAAFEPCGFRKEAFYPCYGLAEATLMVSGGPSTRPPVVLPVRGEDLRRDRVATISATDPDAALLVGCGRLVPATRVAIVDPASCRERAVGSIGEIWIGGPGVAHGYWNRIAETEQTFHATLADTGEGPFLRTGDLGFLDGDELFVTGRLKDLIIIDGRNHYPQDIELTVENSCPSIAAGCCAAFSIEHQGTEKLVIAAEVVFRKAGANSEAEELARKHTGLVKIIRRAVAKTHDVNVHAVSLLKVGSLAKTSSGKLQRSLCREQFLAGARGEKAEYREVVVPPRVDAAGAREGEKAPIRSVEEIRTWLTARLSEHLGIEPQAVDLRQSFADYGLGSKDALLLVGDLERWVGHHVSPTLLYQYPSIEALTSYLGGRVLPDAHAAATGSTSEPIAIVGMGRRFPGAAELDLGAEGVLPADIDGMSIPAGRSDSADAIFLTGATGYLGTCLLADLLRLTNARIYCLVRGRSVDEGRRRLEGELVRRFPEMRGELSRIVPISGNLAKPLLGLSAEDFHSLSRKVDVIYHSGAVINFLESYEVLKSVNVLAAEAILRLASTVRVKAVHFVSSFSVFMSPHYVNAAFVPEQDGPEHWNGLPNGYAQSKWVSDRLMRQAMLRGIPVCIYRPGFISGHSRTGECKLEDLPQRLIKGCIQLGAAPQLAGASLDLTPVDFVSSALVHLSRRSDSVGKAFNLVNPAPIAWNRLVELIRRFGYPIEVVSFQEWLRQLRSAEDSNALHALRGLVELTPKELLVNLPPFDRRNTLTGLSDSSIGCPSVEDMLDTYFSFFIDSGFLHAPVSHATSCFQLSSSRFVRRKYR
jgi:thioester reductase-like protein